MARDARNKRPLMTTCPISGSIWTRTIRHCAAPWWKWWVPIRSSTAPTSGGYDNRDLTAGLGLSDAEVAKIRSGNAGGIAFGLSQRNRVDCLNN